jgi:hypothetical protein
VLLEQSIVSRGVGVLGESILFVSGGDYELPKCIQGDPKHFTFLQVVSESVRSIFKFLCIFTHDEFRCPKKR